MENNNKSKNIIYVTLLIILGLIILGLVGYICYDKEIIFSENNKVEEKLEEKEIEIDDYALKQDLANKIYYLNNGSNAGLLEKKIPVSLASNGIDGYSYRKSDINKLTHDEKIISVMYLLLEYFDRYVQYSEMDSRCQQYFKGYYEWNNNLSDSGVYGIPKKYVEEKYEMLFGEKLTEHRDIKGCPSYIYDTKTESYYSGTACGGTSSDYIYLYNNKYTKKGNESYVYVAKGITGIDANDNCYVHDMEKNAVETCSDNFIINETNYSKYSKYKYTFTKDSIGNYYFTKVEKIK